MAETLGSAGGARIVSAASIDAATVDALFGDRIETVRRVRFDPATGGVSALRERRLGAITLASGPDEGAAPEAIESALIEGVRHGGLGLLRWPEEALALRDRAAFAARHGASVDLGDDALVRALDQWLPPLLAGKRRLSDIPAAAVVDALHDIIGWDGRQALDRLAPARFTSPAGSTHAIDYAAEGGPRVELRPQTLFGLAAHPMVGGDKVPLVLSLTSPAGRPIQTTRDLPGFWSGSWAAVAKDMRGRYPRHPWPDDPAGAAATLRTKRADARK